MIAIRSYNCYFVATVAICSYLQVAAVGVGGAKASPTYFSYIILDYIILDYIILYYIILYYVILYYVILHYIIYRAAPGVGGAKASSVGE